MSQGSGEKKHQPTERRLREARRRGEWFSSGELTAAALLAAIALMWSALLPSLADRAVALARRVWDPERIASTDPLHTVDATARATAQTLSVMVAVVMLTLFCIAAVVRFLQVGPMFSTRHLWNVQVLNPSAGFKNIFFNGKTYQKAAINAAKAGIVMLLSAVMIRSSLRDLLLSERVGPAASVRVFQKSFTAFLWSVAVLYLLFGAADYWIERRSFYKKNMMTNEELREDYKEDRGNVEAKVRIRILGRMQATRIAAENSPERKRARLVAGLFRKLLG